MLREDQGQSKVNKNSEQGQGKVKATQGQQ